MLWCCGTHQHTNFFKPVSHKPVFPSENCNFPPGNCAQKVCIVRVFRKKQKKHTNRFCAKNFFGKNTGLKQFVCFFPREREKCVLVGGWVVVVMCVWVGGGGGGGSFELACGPHSFCSFLKSWPKKLQSPSLVTTVARPRPVLLVTCQGCFH